MQFIHTDRYFVKTITAADLTLTSKERNNMTKNENKAKNQMQSKSPSSNKANSQGVKTLESITLQTKRYEKED